MKLPTVESIDVRIAEANADLLKETSGMAIGSCISFINYLHDLKNYLEKRKDR